VTNLLWLPDVILTEATVKLFLAACPVRHCAPLCAQQRLCHRPCSSVASASALTKERSAGADAGAMEWKGRLSGGYSLRSPVSSGAEAEAVFLRLVRIHPPVSVHVPPCPSSRRCAGRRAAEPLTLSFLAAAHDALEA
jgi:hypothetical protein